MNDHTHRELHDIPIGIRANGMRRETDAMGEIEVPADCYWGTDAVQPRAFLDRRRPNAKARLSRLWVCQKGGGVGQCRRRPAAATRKMG